MKILEHEDERHLFAGARQQRADRFGQSKPCGLILRGRLAAAQRHALAELRNDESDPITEQVEPIASRIGIEQSGERAQHLGPQPEGRGSVEVGAATPQDAGAPCGRHGRELPRQARLSNPCFAREKDDTAPPVESIIQGTTELRELPLAAQECTTLLCRGRSDAWSARHHYGILENEITASAFLFKSNGAPSRSSNDSVRGGGAPTASSQGRSYQTLISSLLHRYASGRLEEV
ncbi:MAG TPA: hypothetical protein VMO26_26885 [Vicinamibacterales bacterium]|nr:hypothetical protein [Vicinamibacterales bacterium]